MIESLPNISADTVWHLWWPGMACLETPIKDAFVLHRNPGALLSALGALPDGAIAIHHTVDVADCAEFLLEARALGWIGAVAIEGGWLMENRWLEDGLGPAFEIDSWERFLRDPQQGITPVCLAPAATPVRSDAYALDQLPGAMCVVEDGALVQMNDAFSSLVGISGDDLRALPLIGLWTKATVGKAFLKRLGALDRDREFSVEAEWLRGDQRIISVELRGRVIDSSEPCRRRWMIAVNDISRRQRALEFMQLQRELVERASSAILILEVSPEDPLPRIRFANACWEQISGYRIEDTIGMDLSCLDNTGDVFSFSETMRTVIERGKSTFITVPCGRRGHAGFWADITLFPLDSEEHGVVRFVALLHDVTERVEAERQLAASERRYRLLFKDNRLPMFLHDDKTGRIVDCNVAASNFSGYHRTVLIGKHISDLAVGEVKMAGAPNGPSYRRHQRADGSIRYVLIYEGDFQFEMEHAVRYSILVDCTAQYEAKTGLLEAVEAMRQANKAKSEFLQVVGHEIRTPMNTILGFADLLRDSETEEERNESLEMIELGTRNLLRVVESVVDYIEAGLDSSCEAFHKTDVHEFCESAVRPYVFAALQNAVRFNLSMPPDGPPMVALPVRAYQKIIAHLLDNAVKFTTEGRIDVAVSFDTSESMIEFCISDTGIGLSEGQMEMLYQPFTANDMSTERAYEGLGMGLALCHKLVKQYQGSIACKSDQTKGTVFTIQLPCTF